VAAGVDSAFGADARAEEMSAMAELMARIVEHPKTSVTGVLLALTTVLGVLQQQGIGLGHVGSGTVVSLACALATAVLGLLAKD
jgi:uncharacterized membrane protein YczE